MIPVTVESIAVESRMTRAASTAAIVIVESGVDLRLFARFFRIETSEFIVADGKENAMHAVSILDSGRAIEGYIAIVDSDFDRVLENALAVRSPNIVRTDHHDAETMVIFSGAFSRFCHEFCSDKARSWGSTPEEWATALARSIQPLSHLRLYNCARKGSLCFEGLRFDRVFDRRSLSCDTSKLKQRIIALTQARVKEMEGDTDPDKMIRCEVMRRSITEWPTDSQMKAEIGKCRTTDLRSITNGHDLVELLSVALRHAFASLDDKTAAVENLAKILRLSYSPDDFRGSELHTEIRAWESRNLKFLRR